MDLQRTIKPSFYSGNGSLFTDCCCYAWAWRRWRSGPRTPSCCTRKLFYVSTYYYCENSTCQFRILSAIFFSIPVSLFAGPVSLFILYYSHSGFSENFVKKMSFSMYVLFADSLFAAVSFCKLQKGLGLLRGLYSVYWKNYVNFSVNYAHIDTGHQGSIH